MRKRTLSILFFFLLFQASAISQSINSCVINAAGGSHSFGYIKIDWNVGEMALVNTLQSGDFKIIITNGFLQPYTDYPADSNLGSSFGPEEIRIFPNPVSAYLEINFLTKQQGKISYQLYDALGRQLYNKTFLYYGYGQIEKFNMERFPPSVYYLHILLEADPGSVNKKSSYKIVKFR